MSLEFMIQEVKPDKLMFWIEVGEAKNSDKRFKKEIKEGCIHVEDDGDVTIEDQIDDFMIVLLTCINLFKGKRGRGLKAQEINKEGTN